jgi:hypothetical protein
MPKSSKQVLATKAAYNRKPEVMAKRVEDNRLRRAAIAKGVAHVGDGTAMHHVNENERNGGKVVKVDAEYNKGWRGRKPGNYTKQK